MPTVNKTKTTLFRFKMCCSDRDNEKKIECADRLNLLHPKERGILAELDQNENTISLENPTVSSHRNLYSLSFPG